MTEKIVYSIDSLGVSTSALMPAMTQDFPSLFLSGGPAPMTIITLLLVAVLFSAWKAPAWTKDLGKIALAAGVLVSLIGLFQMFNLLQVYGDMSPAVIFGGLKSVVIPLIYAVGVYVVALAIHIIEKPRI